MTAKRRFDAEMLDIDVCAEIPIENQARKRAIQQAHIKVIKGIAHHVALIRRETQLVSGKTGTIQGQSGLHQRAVDIAAAAESQIHSENLLT